MNIIEKLKNLNVEITEEIEKALSGDWVSKYEMEKKVNAVLAENTSLKESAEATAKELEALKINATDIDTYTTKINELTQTLEAERAERAKKDEEARLGAQVNDFFANKVFVNDITRDAIKAQLIEKLNSDFARGKSIEDLFNSIINDEDGNLKPNIIVTEQAQELAKKRSQIVGAVINQPTGAKLSTAELMRMKNANPELDITPYLNRK